MYAQLEDTTGKRIHTTRGAEGHDRWLFNWFPRVPLVQHFEGRFYVDTGTYADIGGVGFRVYREGHRTSELKAQGE